MSKIVEFRDAIMSAIRDKYPALNVDWYDGIFDVEDVKEWTMSTPCAWVSVNTVPTTHHTTGEMNASLRCVIAILESDRRSPRDADARCWDYMEGIADLANLNIFGYVDAAPATAVKLLRVTDPELRREGVALGLCEWMSGITFGRNRTAGHEFIYHNDERVIQTPQTLNTQATVVVNDSRSAELLGLPIDDDAFTGRSVLDQGVAEWRMTNSQEWEPDPK